MSLPHRGLVSEKDAEGFFDKVLVSVTDWHNSILNMGRKGYTEDETLDTLRRKYYSEAIADYQPKEAFFANARALISCTLRENTALA